MSLALTIRATPTEWMEPLTLEEVCLAKRHLGEYRVRRALEGTGLKGKDRLGELSEADREMAVLVLRDRYPNLMD